MTPGPSDAPRGGATGAAASRRGAASCGARRGATVVAVAMVAASLSGCGIWGPEGGPGGAGIVAPTVSTNAATVDAVLGADGVQRVEVSAGDDLRFSPARVRAHLGTIEFVFHNVGNTPHAVEVSVGSSAPGSGNMNGGQSQTVRVTVTAPGEYPFPCVYHVSSGMVGTLVVVGETPPATSG